MSANSHRRSFGPEYGRPVASGRRSPRDILDKMRVARMVARASITEVALVSGIPRWKVQELLAGTAQPKPFELRALRQAIAKLGRAHRHKKLLLREANLRAAGV